MDSCEICKKRFHRASSLKKNSKHNFCGIPCFRIWWGKNVVPKFRGKGNVNWKGGEKEKHCIACSKIFFVLPHYYKRARFCGHACNARFQFTGSKNPNWNGGITEETRKERMTPEYETWRFRVFNRDKRTCKICETKNRSILVAHHIKVWKYFPELRFEISNGLTLCRSCHMKLHASHRDVIDFTEILRDYMPKSD